MIARASASSMPRVPGARAARRRTRGRGPHRGLAVVGREVAGARAHDVVGVARHLHLDLAELAVALGVAGLVGHQVVAVVLREHLAHARVELVRAVDQEAAGVGRDRLERERKSWSLCGRPASQSGRRRHDLARRGSVDVADEPAAVDRVDDRAGARGRVDDRAQVPGALLARAGADEEAVGDEQAELAPRQRAPGRA